MRKTAPGSESSWLMTEWGKLPVHSYTTTPKLLAEKVYGSGKLRELLKKREKRFLSGESNVPKYVKDRIPSYDPETWNEKVQVNEPEVDAPPYILRHPEHHVIPLQRKPRLEAYATSRRTEIRGSGRDAEGFTNVFKIRERAPAKVVFTRTRGALPDPTMDAVLAHEVTHIQDPVDRPKVSNKEFSSWEEAADWQDAQKSKYDELLPSKHDALITPSGRAFRAALNEGQREIFDHARAENEVVPNMTAAVREFYRREGRTVESPEDVQKAIDYYDDVMSPAIGSLHTEALRSLPYINDLGMMLVKNTIKKKPTTIGSSMRGIV